MEQTNQWRRYMMGIVMLQCSCPGHVGASLPNVLAAYEARWVLPYFTALTPVLGIFSALIFGSLSDRKVDAGVAGNPRFVRRCLPRLSFPP